MSVNAVTSGGTHRDVYVGTIRDITASRAAASREAAVVRLAAAVSVAKSVPEVLSITLDECATTIDVASVVAVMWLANGGDPVVYAADDYDEPSWPELDPFLRKVFADARGRLPLTVEPVGRDEHAATSDGIVAMLSDDVALWLAYATPRQVSTEDRLLVTALVGHLSLAVAHARQFETARETSLTLQRAMLAPMHPPPGFAVRYEPAVEPLEIGGDWYDVLAVDEHRIGIIVGDCVGRGLSAAAVMGQLRSSARALLLTGAEPARLLEQLDAAAALIPDAYCTTVFAAILDTQCGRLHYSSAGHLPALLATPAAGTTLLGDAGSVPLAVRRNHPRPQAAVTPLPGSTLMLFTDGLIERRGIPIDQEIERVAETLTQTSGLPVNEVPDIILRELSPDEGYDDDVAIVICRAWPAGLRIENDAAPERLRGMRHRLAAWLQAAAVPAALAGDIVIAVNEACTNSIEHAFRGSDAGTISVEAEIGGADIHVRVIDSGLWKTPPSDPGIRGRGLPLIKALSDRGVLDGTPKGTTIELSFRMPAKPAAQD
jgi:anti-sigma regulatory factor (Ser/Thr protein kinase)